MGHREVGSALVIRQSDGLRERSGDRLAVCADCVYLATEEPLPRHCSCQGQCDEQEGKAVHGSHSSKRSLETAQLPTDGRSQCW